MSTYWKSVGPSLSFKSLLLLRHDRHYSLIHTTSLWDKLNNSVPENFSTSSTEFVNPPSPAASPPETGSAWWGWGQGRPGERPTGSAGTETRERCSPSALCEASGRHRGAGLTQLLSAFDQPSYKAVISLFKFLQSNVLTFLT